MISRKRKFIFIHIPKCGGTSVEDALFKPCTHRTAKDLWMFPNKYQSGGLQHLKASHILQEEGEKIFNNCFKFSFIRNPWDKMISQYRYTIESSNPYLRKWIDIDMNDSFNEYLKKVFNAAIHVQWDSQYKFLYDSKDNQLVDFIGRFENLQEDFNIVCDKIGIPKPHLSHKNKTKHKHYTEHYDDEAREIIAEKYAKDIEHFGYKFGA